MDDMIKRRRELLLKEYSHGLEIEEKIELHELDEDIKVLKLSQMLDS